METPPKVNTICGHILGLYCKSLEGIGRAVMENEGKYAWAPLPIGWAPPAHAHAPWASLNNFCNSHPISLKLSG
jgi:hypothetical protein